MKTITTHEHDLILDVRNEGLSSLPPGIFEKDLLITEVLHILADTETDGVGLVFCGGTCLSKAHDVIERMSEDVDFKLILPEGLSRSASKRLLSQLKKHLTSTFEAAGFVVPSEQIVARDENRYISLNLLYESRFAKVASLRPEVKVELSVRPPVLPTASLPIASMLAALTGIQQKEFQIDCISIEETLAEKILSFLRRTAQVQTTGSRDDYDDRLVRHLYDVKAIAKAEDGLVLPYEHFKQMVVDDGIQFRYQHPEFVQDPVGQLRLALDAVRSQDLNLESDYQRFVEELVFGEPVTFSEASDVFLELAEQLLNQLR